MASAASNGRLAVIIAVLAFAAGCWAGMGADESGAVYCVVTGESAAARPGAVPGQIVEPLEDGLSDDVEGGEDGGDDGPCQAGELQVCGELEGDDGDERRFVSNECPDD